MAEWAGERTWEDRVVTAREEFMESLRDEIERSWMLAAREKLRSTRDEYADAISVRRRGGQTIEMRLKSDLASVIESGSSSFDLRPGFTQGSGAGKRRKPPGGARFRIVVYRGVARVIPIDADTPAKAQPSGWRHPGIGKRELHLRALEAAQAKLPELSRRMFGRLGRKEGA